MPDKDIFNRKFAPGWRSPARKIYSGANKEETVKSISRALKTFFAHHPEIKKYFNVIMQIICSNSKSNEIYSYLLLYKNKFADRSIGELVFKASWRTYLLLDKSKPNNLYNEKDIEEKLANGICIEIIDYNLISKLPYNKSINANFDTEQLKKEYLPSLIDEVKNLSKSMITGRITPKYRKAYQTPKSVRKSTDEMLYTPIGSI